MQSRYNNKLLVMESWYYQIKSQLQPGLEKKNSLVTMQLPKCIENSFHCLKQIDSILSIIKSVMTLLLLQEM